MKYKFLFVRLGGVAAVGFSLFILLLAGVADANVAKPVVINEIAWMGTKASFRDEWVELYNAGDEPVELEGWKLISDDGTPNIELQGKIAPKGYYLLERTADTTISDIPADGIYTGALDNDAETLRLYNAIGAVVDSVEASSSGWFAGDNSEKNSMERINPLKSGSDPSNWANNNGIMINGKDKGGSPILGTPRHRNSVAVPILCHLLPATIVGTGADDIISGTSGDDVIHGLGGNDTIDGKEGNDVICGGKGDDILQGGEGGDTVSGGDGNDTVSGGNGEDTVNGGAGNDALNGNAGDDVLNGSLGNDQLNGGEGDDKLNAGDGNDTLIGEAGNDTLNASAGDGTLDGGPGDDTVRGGAGFDVCDGGDGVNLIQGCEVEP